MYSDTPKISWRSSSPGPVPDFGSHRWAGIGPSPVGTLTELAAVLIRKLSFVGGCAKSGTRNRPVRANPALRRPGAWAPIRPRAVGPPRGHPTTALRGPGPPEVPGEQVVGRALTVPGRARGKLLRQPGDDRRHRVGTQAREVVRVDLARGVVPLDVALGHPRLGVGQADDQQQHRTRDERRARQPPPRPADPASVAASVRYPVSCRPPPKPLRKMKKTGYLGDGEVAEGGPARPGRPARLGRRASSAESPPAPRARAAATARCRRRRASSSAPPRAATRWQSRPPGPGRTSTGRSRPASGRRRRPSLRSSGARLRGSGAWSSTVGAARGRTPPAPRSAPR